MSPPASKLSMAWRFVHDYSLRIVASIILLVMLYGSAVVYIPYQREHRIQRKIESIQGSIYVDWYGGPAWFPQSLKPKIPLFHRILQVGFPSGYDISPEQLQGIVAELKSLDRLYDLSLRDQTVALAMPEVANLKCLRELGLGESTVTDADLRHLEGLVDLDSLELFDTEVTDLGLAHLSGLKKLRVLKLDNTAITDDGLKHLQTLAALEELTLDSFDCINPSLARSEPWPQGYIASGKVTDRGLTRLQGLRNLNWLELGGNKITDRGLASLAGLTKLRLLRLEVTAVTDAGLEHLRTLANLEVLGLSETKVSDQGLEIAKGLRRLRSLSLDGTSITDEGLKHLKDLPLEYLRIKNTQVTDAGLENLKEMTTLRHLFLDKTPKTEVGFTMLQEALPECQISER